MKVLDHLIKDRIEDVCANIGVSVVDFEGEKSQEKYFFNGPLPNELR